MTAAVPTRDGATVMLVRDGEHPERPLEVFMLRRHPSTAFGSVHVFPGGVVDPSDHDAALATRCPGRTEADLYVWVLDHQRYLANAEGQPLEKLADAAREYLDDRGVE